MTRPGFNRVMEKYLARFLDALRTMVHNFKFAVHRFLVNWTFKLFT